MPLDGSSAAPPLIREFFAARDLNHAKVWTSGRAIDSTALGEALSGNRRQLQPWPWGRVVGRVDRPNLPRKNVQAQLAILRDLELDPDLLADPPCHRRRPSAFASDRRSATAWP